MTPQRIEEIKHNLREATATKMTARELERHCADALAVIEEIEKRIEEGEEPVMTASMIGLINRTAP